MDARHWGYWWSLNVYPVWGLGRHPALPNGSRLSCGAGLEHSQGEFYHTALKTFSGSLGTGAASFKRWLGCAPQVIARVRPCRCARGHSPSLALRRDCDAEWTEAPE